MVWMEIVVSLLQMQRRDIPSGCLRERKFCPFQQIYFVDERGVNGDEEFDEAGRDDDVEEASDGEFPVVVGRDGSGNDDASCIDG